MTPLAPLFAAGCVPLGERITGYRDVTTGFGVNAALCGLIGLLLLPLSVLGHTPLPAISPLVADQVGWPTSVDQIATVHDEGLREHGLPVAIITSNYGEAGAIARYGQALGLPEPVSGHNQLHSLGGPAEEAETVVLVGHGGQAELFENCRVTTTLDNEAGVDNEEQGVPVRLCHGPLKPWDALWSEFAHLD